MTGIERLHKLIADIDVSADPELWYILRRGIEGDWGCEEHDDKTLGSTLAAIADQIKREQGGRVSRMRVLAVVTEMERHVSGVEGMEDSPVARWARELREALGGNGRDHAADVSVSVYDLLPQEDREAIAWVRYHGGRDEVRMELDNLRGSIKETCARLGVEHTGDLTADAQGIWRAIDRLKSLLGDSVPRAAYERHLARRQRQIDECHAALRRRNQRISVLASEINRAHNENYNELMRRSGNYMAFADEVCKRLAPQLRCAEGCTKDVMDAALDALDRRLVPEGCEWPRYEDGELVPLGGEFMGKDGKTYTAKQIQFIGKCFSLFDFCDRKPQFSGFYGERVERPAVLAADGEPLEVGQTVWSAKDGTEYKVGEIRDTTDDDGEPCKIIGCSNDELHIYCAYFPPEKLTHQRPVLDADGVPIHEGDTVYLLPGEWCDKFPCHGFHGGEELEVFAAGEADHVPGGVQCREKEKTLGIYGTCYPQPDQLTHTKPEPVDTWERIEEDAKKEACAYFGVENGGYGCSECPVKHWEESCDEVKSSDLVHRCRALAERERGE